MPARQSVMARTVPSVAVNATGEPASARDRGALDRPDRAVLALDIGGTKLAAGIVMGTGEILLQHRVATDRGNPWPGVEGLVSGAVSYTHLTLPTKA